MKITLKFSYIIMLVSSILLYAVPFEYGGNFTKSVIALVVTIFSIYAMKKVWQDFTTADRFNILILLINTFAILHFSLIFFTVVIEVSYFLLFIVGSLIGAILYYVVSHRMRNY